MLKSNRLFLKLAKPKYIEYTHIYQGFPAFFTIIGFQTLVATMLILVFALEPFVFGTNSQQSFLMCSQITVYIILKMHQTTWYLRMDSNSFARNPALQVTCHGSLVMVWCLGT